MFTGLIERVGQLERRDPRGTGARLVIRHAPWTDGPLAPGESVAVNGVCLTAADIRPDAFACDVLAETLRLTSLGRLGPGAPVNLERALRADGRFGGHLVSGHVDGVGRLARREPVGSDWRLVVAATPEILDGMVLKGSVSLDGVSLTLTEVTSVDFSVHIIPFTWTQTALSGCEIGAALNIETDMIGKYIRKWIPGVDPTRPPHRSHRASDAW